MAVDSIVAKIRFASFKPLDKGRMVEAADLGKWFLPMNCLSLFGPEVGTLF